MKWCKTKISGRKKKRERAAFSSSSSPFAHNPQQPNPTHPPITPLLWRRLSVLPLGICHGTLCKILSCGWMLLCALWGTARLTHQIRLPFFLFFFFTDPIFTANTPELSSCKRISRESRSN